MFINSAGLNKELSRITSLAKMDKKVPGILFDIKPKDDKVEIYYQSSGKAIKTSVEAYFTDDEKQSEKAISGKIIFDYKRLTDIISYCQSSGNIKVDNVEMTFTENLTGPGTCVITAVKKVDIVRGDETESRVAANYVQELSWWKVENATVQQKILSRDCCEDMFNDIGAASIDCDELCRMFKDCLAGDAKQVYLAPKFNGAFACNTNSTVFTPYLAGGDNKIGKAMSVTSNLAKAIVEVFSGEPGDLYVNDFRDEAGKTTAFIVFNEAKTISIYVSAAPVNPANVSTLDKYHQMMYGTHQITVMTEVLNDVLKASMNLGSGESVDLKFNRDSEDPTRVKGLVLATNTGTSVNNSYELVCEQYRTLNEISAEEAANNLEVVKMNANVKNIFDIVNKHKGQYMALDFQTIENSTFMRIGFLDNEVGEEAVKNYLTEYEKSAEDITVEDFINLRPKTFVACYYVAVSRSSK